MFHLNLARAQEHDELATKLKMFREKEREIKERLQDIANECNGSLEADSPPADHRVVQFPVDLTDDGGSPRR